MSALDDWLLQDASATGGAGRSDAKTCFSNSQVILSTSEYISFTDITNAALYFNPI